VTNFEDIYNDIPTYSRFLRVEEIDDLVHSIVQFPGVEYKTIGKTIENEPLNILGIGQGEKTALIIGVPHSDEPLGSLVVTFFARWLVTHPEKNFFGWRWLFIPMLEKRGMKLNEGWFNMPQSFAALSKSNFREPAEDQYEWTFPIEYDFYSWTKSRPETLAIKNVLEKEKPDLLCNLHHSGFYNAYYYLSEDVPHVYTDLKKLAKNCRLPLSDSSPDVPFGKMFEPGFYQMYGLKDYIDYYKEKDPAVLTTLRRGACSDEWYSEKIGGFSFNCEVPLYLSAKMQDKKPSKKSLIKVLTDKYNRQKSRLKYSIKMINVLKDYADLADPLLLDVAEKHIANAQASLDHEKRLLEKTMEKPITNSDVFEHGVMADIFDLFFLGQIWRVAESICIKGGNPKICNVMDVLDIELKNLEKQTQIKGNFYQLPIRNSVKMQLGSILIIAEELKNRNAI
jgi:hypothetical protein